MAAVLATRDMVSCHGFYMASTAWWVIVHVGGRGFSGQIARGVRPTPFEIPWCCVQVEPKPARR